MFNPFKNHIKVTFHLKSGKSTTIKCADIKITKSGSELASYSISGAVVDKEDPLFWIAMDQIELITIKR